MSVKLLFDKRQQLMNRLGPNYCNQPVRNTLVFFGGYISRNPRGGQGLTASDRFIMAPPPMTPAGTSGPPGTPPPLWPVALPTHSMMAYEEIKAKLEEATGRHQGRAVTNSYDACMMGNSPDQCRTECRDLRIEAARWVFGTGGMFDPRGALIVYGYSAGAFNAVWFCEEAAQNHAWFDFASHRAQRSGNQTQGSEIFIDLLITVDPSIDNLPGGREASLTSPRIIRRHINYYRREQHTPQSRITREVREPDHYVDNRPRSVPRHEDMPDATLEGVEWEIRHVLNTLANARNN
ncbi:MAG: hypothetical protein RKR03_20555 [Candidatus Competibacter sp.]|nr:hypothetical protein [Candidatus Competibacter sp.]MDS4058949.1 hypothetical protein [Candidatus Contendobacter sp.]